LVDAGVEGAAAFWAQRRIAGTARIGAKGFENVRLFDALAIGESGAGIAPKAPGIAKRVDHASARDDAGTEIGVGFRAGTCAEGKARKRLPARVEESGLVIAARVRPAEAVGIGVFYFVLVAGSGSALTERIRGLFEKAGAIELIRGEKS